MAYRYYSLYIAQKVMKLRPDARDVPAVINNDGPELRADQPLRALFVVTTPSPAQVRWSGRGIGCADGLSAGDNVAGGRGARVGAVQTLWCCSSLPAVTAPLGDDQRRDGYRSSTIAPFGCF